jgi:hypothetical protein
VTTLRAAGLLDVDAGEIVRPGIIRIEGERIAGIGGPVSDGSAAVIEHPLHHHVKRVLVLDGLLGSTRELTREAGRVVIAARTAPGLIDL